jgi:drug/metabolite transporter (DMT)-like permease
VPNLLRIIAVVQGLLGVFALLAAWFGDDRNFLLGLLLLVSALISAALFAALAEILENSERMRAELGSLRDDLRRKLGAQQVAMPIPGRAASSSSLPPAMEAIRESVDPATGRITYIYNGVGYDSRFSAVEQLTRDEWRERQSPESPPSG